ncbi:MAG: histone deacetylase family protein [Gammaproteobacteria bacterium]|nr:histone deacetylase family protein [Gammaproteobacteria bacterium]
MMLFISHTDCELHDMGTDHPESPLRIDAITKAIKGSAINDRIKFLEAPLVNKDHLYRVHDKDYVDAVFENAPDEGILRLDPDTSMNPHSLNAARRAAGAVIHAVDLVLATSSERAFCCVRPPGHHAERDQAMGFCIFNNIAAGAAHALNTHGLSRVAIVDFDVHHGNGTEDIFQDNPAVMLCSSFQHPFYPHSGATTELQHIINLPLPSGTDGHAYRNAVEMKFIPALEDFKPELVMFSAGFDAHKNDPLAGLMLVEEDYRWITEKVIEIANQSADGRIISVLEGGYDLAALGDSALAHIEAMV